MLGIATRREVLAKVLVAVVAGVGGCASGEVRFAKFSPDSKRLVYEDSKHWRVYVTDLDRRETRSFYGRLVAMDPEVRRFVIREDASGSAEHAIPLRLLSVCDSGFESKPLPALVAEGEYEGLSMDFEADPDGLHAVLRLKGGSWQYSRLALTDTAWPARTGQMVDGDGREAWHPRVPGGIAEGGHVYCPDLYDPGPQWKPGIDAVSARSPGALDYELPSADGRYVLRIASFGGRPPGLVLLDHSCTPAREDAIFQKNDAALDVAVVAILVPMVAVWAPLHWLEYWLAYSTHSVCTGR